MYSLKDRSTSAVPIDVVFIVAVILSVAARNWILMMFRARAMMDDDVLFLAIFFWSSFLFATNKGVPAVLTSFHRPYYKFATARRLLP
jgi:hypothetical protein